jgi:hypothetical protein
MKRLKLWQERKGEREGKRREIPKIGFLYLEYDPSA